MTHAPAVANRAPPGTDPDLRGKPADRRGDRRRGGSFCVPDGAPGWQNLQRAGRATHASVGAKLVAGSSLFRWFGVIYWGRMLPFIGNAF